MNTMENIKINNNMISKEDDIGLDIDGGITEAEIKVPQDEEENIILKEKVQPKQIPKKKIHKTTEIFTPAIMNKYFVLPFKSYDKNIRETLLRHIKTNLEGKCLKEGYVKPNSVEIIEYSPGSIVSDNIKFQVSLQCMVCYPVEGMVIDCSVKNVTKAGIRAEISKYEKTPMVIFVARDHHYDNSNFANIKEDDIIQIKVVGMRFELNDTYVSVIAELM